MTWHEKHVLGRVAGQEERSEMGLIRCYRLDEWPIRAWWYAALWRAEVSADSFDTEEHIREATG